MWTPSTAIFEDDNASARFAVLQAAATPCMSRQKAVADGKHLCCGRTYLPAAWWTKHVPKPGIDRQPAAFCRKGIAIVGWSPRAC
jgi:hypothetical protein